MKVLPSCEFFTGATVPLSNKLLKDTLLVLSKKEGKRKIDAFLLHSKEVSINEWKLFYAEKVQEIGKEKALELFHTDTMCWLHEIPYSYGEPMMSSYYQHPAFADYPIVGVDWYQATEYCKWLTQKANQTLANNGIPQEVEFRLPTSLELEYAALIPSPDFVNSLAAKIGKFRRTRFPYHVFPYNSEEKYLANFGEIYSSHGILLKHDSSDGYTFTNAPRSYPPNAFGLYDISGNVAEWTSTTATFPNMEQYDIKNNESEILETIEQQLENIPQSEEYQEYRELLVKSILHDIRMINKSAGKKVVKGGSWADPLPYLYCNAEEVQLPTRKNCRIGFRVAMTYNKELEHYYKKLGIKE